MMKKTNALTITLLTTLLLVSAYTVATAKATQGPRSDVDVRFYGSQENAYAALKAGDVDFIQWSVTYEQRIDVESDPDLCISGYSENGMIEFDLNNNYTMVGLPGIKNPVTNKHFRRALSCMIEKEYIIDEILRGAAGLLNVPIPLNSISWWPTCALEGNYPWSYNMTKAAEQLAIAGFTDTEPDGTVNYPLGWPGVTPDGKNMDPLVVYVRTEDKRLDAGRYFCDQMDLLHIPYTKFEYSSDVCFPAVMKDRNYHVYTGGWSLERYPTFLYNGFHSDFYFADGSNYVTGMNSSNLPNYPDYDALSHTVYYTASITACQVATKAAAALGWCDYVFNIPLWSYRSFVAWRKDMPGVVNMFGYGLDNRYQFMNAYKVGSTLITMGTISAPKAMNPLYSQWIYDYAVLDRVFDSLLYYNPYDLGIDQPWAAQDWEVDTWIDPDPGPGEPSTKTMVRYYLRTDCGIVSPTGAFIRNLNAYDLEFGCWYTYAFSDGWNWANYQDVHHTKIINDYTIEYYFDDASYWFYTAPQYPILPKTELIDTLCTVTSTTITVSGNVSADTTYWLDCDPIVTVTSDTIPVDYKIVAGYETYRHTGISFDTVPSDGTYTINYYTPDLDPHGYYLAGLPPSVTWYTTGAFYAIDIEEGVGGWVSFNRNPYYWMETPSLGEVDWRWVWETPGGIPGPEHPGRDSGHYEKGFHDIVMGLASYCHRGDGPCDPQYFPGADVDPADLGHVGSYDMALIGGGEYNILVVTEIVHCKTVVGQGYTSAINVTVENVGDPETFDLTAYANTTVIGTSRVTLSHGYSATVTFTWNTTGCTKGNYTISAYATPGQYEQVIGDNTLIDDFIFVTISGDVDGDRDVDIYDVVKITGIYRSKIGDPEYKCNSDIDSDGDIDIYDVVKCTGHYNQSW